MAREKLLFVCARNRIRSLTAEQMFAGSQLYDVKSRGVASNARIKLTAKDLAWADRVFVMEKNHKNRITELFSDVIDGSDIVCLHIEDAYQPMEPALIDELKAKLASYVEL
jgi:predicted protein tyrosine phosphatase